MSTSWIQCRLKQMSNTPRILASVDPAEALLERISLLQTIETCYFRGLIDAFQIRALEIWLSTGEVISRYELLAALEAIATISRYDDQSFAQMNTDKGKSLEEILHDLLVLSEDFTVCIDHVVKEEDIPSNGEDARLN